jgi:hypothetical protein
MNAAGVGDAQAVGEAVSSTVFAEGAAFSEGVSTAIAVGEEVTVDDDMRMHRHWIQQREVWLQETEEEEAELMALAHLAVRQLSRDYMEQMRR